MVSLQNKSGKKQNIYQQEGFTALPKRVQKENYEVTIFTTNCKTKTTQNV